MKGLFKSQNEANPTYLFLQFQKISGFGKAGPGDAQGRGGGDGCARGPRDAGRRRRGPPPQPRARCAARELDGGPRPRDPLLVSRGTAGFRFLLLWPLQFSCYFSGISASEVKQVSKQVRPVLLEEKTKEKRPRYPRATKVHVTWLFQYTKSSTTRLV